MSEYMPTVEDLVVAWTEVRLERSKRANASECLAAARRAITAHDAELRAEIEADLRERIATTIEAEGRCREGAQLPWRVSADIARGES